MKAKGSKIVSFCLRYYAFFISPLNNEKTNGTNQPSYILMHLCIYLLIGKCLRIAPFLKTMVFGPLQGLGIFLLRNGAVLWHSSPSHIKFAL